MSIKNRLEITVKAQTDEVGNDIAFSRLKDIQENTYEELASGRLLLAAGATVTLDVAQITTIQFLHMEVQKSKVIVKLDVGEHEVPMVPLTGKKSRFILEDCDVTALKVTNPSGATAAEVVWFAAGV